MSIKVLSEKLQSYKFLGRLKHFFIYLHIYIYIYTYIYVFFLFSLDLKKKRFFCNFLSK